MYVTGAVKFIVEFFFNDFIVSEIRFDILKRVINNNLSVSSWHFNRFKHLNLKVID